MDAIRKFALLKNPASYALGIASSLIVMAAALCLPVNTKAETVSQKQAKVYAQQFFNQAYKEVSAPVKFIYNGKRLTTDRLFTPFYVYNHPRGGFVIISAENKTFPILAYSLKSSFDPDKLSEGEKGWLKSYALDIELIRYDSRIPEAAIKSWVDFPSYVVGILDAPYIATDPRICYEDALEAIDSLLSSPEGAEDGSFSAFYTPSQWKEMMNSEFEETQSVPVAFVDMQRKVFTGVVHGRKGDYYRIAFDRRNDWYMRLMAAEYLGERLVALVGNPRYVPEEEPEEVPFAFYDSYASEFTRSASGAGSDAVTVTNDIPIIKSTGGGHFGILCPENVKLAMIYNLNGSHIGRVTYKDTQMAHINIEAQPRGFYFAIIYGESGKPYGIKLYR